MNEEKNEQILNSSLFFFRGLNLTGGVVLLPARALSRVVGGPAGPARLLVRPLHVGRALVWAVSHVLPPSGHL